MSEPMNYVKMIFQKRTFYESITEAAKSIENGSPSVIVSVCKGKRKTHKGYKFEYVK